MATAAHALLSLPELSRPVADWVESVRELTQPDAVHWCEGGGCGDARAHRELLASGELKSLNAEDISRAATCTARPRATWRASST